MMNLKQVSDPNCGGLYVRWGPRDDQITNLVCSSGRTQRGDHRDGGPVWGGPCLVHHPAAIEGAAVVRKKKRVFSFLGLWDPCGPLIFYQVPASFSGARGDHVGGVWSGLWSMELEILTILLPQARNPSGFRLGSVYNVWCWDEGKEGYMVWECMGKGGHHLWVKLMG